MRNCLAPLSLLALAAALGACAPATGGAGASSDIEFRCAAESRMAASQGTTRTDARLRALDTRRDCIEDATTPRGGQGGGQGMGM